MGKKNSELQAKEDTIIKTKNDKFLVIAQPNDLIRKTEWSLSGTATKLYSYVIAHIDVYHPSKEAEVTITLSDFIEFMNRKSENYKDIRESAEELRLKSIKLCIINNTGEQIYLNTGLITSFLWPKNGRTITFRFNKELYTCLTSMKSKFLQTSIISIKKLPASKNAITLYQYVLSYVRERKKLVIDVDPDELINCLASNNYAKFSAFKVNVLEPAIKKINNSKVEYLLDYEVWKSGHKINSIIFHVRPRTSPDEVDFDTIEKPEKFEKLKNLLIYGNEEGKDKNRNNKKQEDDTKTVQPDKINEDQQNDIEKVTPLEISDETYAMLDELEGDTL